MRKFIHILKAYILWVWYYLNKKYRDERKEEAIIRYTICKRCKYFYNASGRCCVCGCFMAVKTKLYFQKDYRGISLHGCPEKKW